MKRVFIYLLLGLISQQLNAQVPAKPSAPGGISSLCNINADTRYTTRSVENATSYLWSLFPAEAGTLAPQDTAVVINFSENYDGLAKLIVIASNSFGNSLPSDTLVISILGLPDVPIKPIGDSILCFGATQSTYKVLSTKDAESYQWSVNPLSSSFFVQNDTSAVLNIYPDYKGIISINVTASNSCGTSNSSEIKQISIIETPFAPPIPKGEEYYCLNDSVHQFYTTGSFNATFYEWSLEPINAGELILNHDSVEIKWNKEFRKDFSLFVRAGNQCGISERSDTLAGYVKIIPPKPGLISGDTIICEGKDFSVFNINAVDEAERYQWFVSPDTAAVMEGISTQGNAYWNDLNDGLLYIYASTSNICGISPLSDSLAVNFIRKPLKMAMPEGISEMCINPINTEYSSPAIANVSYYQWIIVPANAGIALKDEHLSPINWTDDYMGSVRVAVRAVNSCGTGPSSDSLLISIKERLYADFSYTTNTNTASFTNESFPELALNSFYWNFGDGQSSVEKNPEHQYSVNGNFDVLMVVSNPYCINDTAKASVQITANHIFQHTSLKEAGFEIFPNPANNSLQIKLISEFFSINQIEIVDQSGKIMQIHYPNFVNNNQNIDISNLKAGLYFVKIKSELTIYSLKLIKIN